ncbi:MAG: hypothetical protein D6694_05185 [Gammaproteobacteria bacterium]|nr:MAG: hypothetical protein D6694_05185 [Gammaproteobacteria bacterium]
MTRDQVLLNQDKKEDIHFFRNILFDPNTLPLAVADTKEWVYKRRDLDDTECIGKVTLSRTETSNYVAHIKEETKDHVYVRIKYTGSNLMSYYILHNQAPTREEDRALYKPVDLVLNSILAFIPPTLRARISRSYVDTTIEPYLPTGKHSLILSFQGSFANHYLNPTQEPLDTVVINLLPTLHITHYNTLPKLLVPFDHIQVPSTAEPTIRHLEILAGTLQDFLCIHTPPTSTPRISGMINHLTTNYPGSSYTIQQLLGLLPSHISCRLLQSQSL